ncbi:MAG: shikimate kinase [SAR324 cluster bacterium]|nr:shikimate kinase [SAR324 cluster bacterium]
MRIFLVGFMGAGKSAIGRRLAKRLGYPYFDTDHMIEEQQEKTIKEIFQDEGEAFFRKLETESLKSFEKLTNSVVSTGGGLVATEGNWEIIKAMGDSVFLDADFEDIKERVMRNDKRPLLQTEDPLKTLTDLYKTRRPIYEKADIIIQTGGSHPADIITQIIRSL